MIKNILLYIICFYALSTTAQTSSGTSSGNQNSTVIVDHQKENEISPPVIDTENGSGNANIQIFPVPEKDLIVMQWNNLNTEDINIDLYDSTGHSLESTILYQGSTIAYFDTKKLYGGDYILKIYNGRESFNKKITLVK